jgi:hypothetical protein
MVTESPHVRVAGSTRHDVFGTRAGPDASDVTSPPVPNRGENVAEVPAASSTVSGTAVGGVDVTVGVMDADTVRPSESVT